MHPCCAGVGNLPVNHAIKQWAAMNKPDF